jgi:hypothetical protein
MGFGMNVAVKKPSFFGLAYLAVWNAVVSVLSFKDKTAKSHHNIQW